MQRHEDMETSYPIAVVGIVTYISAGVALLCAPRPWGHWIAFIMTWSFLLWSLW